MARGAVGLFLLALSVSSAAPLAVVAGENAGATAELSWGPDSSVADLPSSSPSPLRLFVRLRGLSSVTAFALHVTWVPGPTDGGYVLESDTLGASACAWLEYAPPARDFLGDSTYDWSIIPTGAPPPTCISLLFQPSTESLTTTARFCLADAHVLDGNGQVDDILAVNSATIGGADSLPACAPSIYLATPGTPAPVGGATASEKVAHRSSSQAGDYSAPLVTLVGNGLDSLTSVTAIDRSGATAIGSVIGKLGGNLATVSFAQLPGSGPWSILPASGDTFGDTLSNAIVATEPLRAQIVPFAEFSAEWGLPNSAVDPWSPNGRFLALQRAGELYVYDMSRPGEAPRRVLAQNVPYLAWSPDGGWLLCRVQSGEEQQKDLFSLIAVPVDSGGPVTVVAHADVGPFLWGSDGKIYFWHLHADARRELDGPPAWHAQNSSPRPSKTFLFWLPQQRSAASGLLRRFTPEIREEASPSGLNRRGIELVSPEGIFPDGQRCLVNIRERGRAPYTAIANLDGTVVRELGSHVGPNAFIGTSVSPDGRYVIGFREIDSGDDIAGAPLFLADAAGARVLPIEGGFNGLWPRFSPTGLLVAFEDPVSGKVHVATLQISAH